MTPVRVRWHGTRRRAQLLGAVRQRLSDWLADWSVRSDWLSLREVGEGSTFERTGWKWRTAGSDEGRIWVGAHASDLSGLGGMLARSASRDDLGLGERIGARALADLLARVLGVEHARAQVTDARSPDPRRADPRFGGLQMLLEGEGLCAVLVLDNGLCERLVPGPAATRATLVPRQTAVGAATVTLDVRLDLGTASVADAHGLSVGDVLVSRTPIDAPFAVVDADGNPMLHASLYRQGVRRSLLVESHSSKRSNR